MQTPSVNRYDVLIAGGAVTGSSVFASSLRASGGARRLFSWRLGYARISANPPYAERGIV